jgi:hypothetical protein
MGELLFKFLLRELKTVHVVCRGKDQKGQECGMAFDVPIDRLASAFPKCQCPVCGTSFRPDAGAADPFGPLATAIKTLNGIKDLEIQLIAPAPAKDQVANP